MSDQPRFEFECSLGTMAVQDIAGFCERLDVDRKHLRFFCPWAAENHDSAWNMARMIFGVFDVVPNFSKVKDVDYMASPESEVALRFGVPEYIVQIEISKMVDRWAHELKTNPDIFEDAGPKKRGRPRKPKPEDEPPQAPPSVVLPIAEGAKVSDGELAQIEAVIVHYGFTMEVFNLAGREDDYRRIEARWFSGRLVEIQKLFEEVSTKSLARQAVINEMHMRRIDDEMSRLPPLNAKFWQYQDAKIKLEEIYSAQWAQIEKLNPALRTQQTKRAFAGVLSEIIEGIRAFQSDPSNEAVDGVFTALELQVEMRSSKQQGGDVQYRPDIVAAINESRRSIWDPKFKRRLEDKHLKILGYAFHEAVKAFTEKTGIEVPDLAADAGEHPQLYIPPPEGVALDSMTFRGEDAPIIPPDEPIKIG